MATFKMRDFEPKPEVKLGVCDCHGVHTAKTTRISRDVRLVCIIKSTVKTDASSGGVQLARDSRLNSRRTSHPLDGIRPLGKAPVQSILPVPKNTQPSAAHSPSGTGADSPFPAEPIHGCALLKTFLHRRITAAAVFRRGRRQNGASARGGGPASSLRLPCLT